MTTRTPLVVGSDGLPQQLQSGDTLNGAVVPTIWTSVTASQSVAASNTMTQFVVAAGTGGAITFTFAAASALTNQFVCWVVNNGNGTATLTPASGNTIDGLSSYVLQTGQSVQILSDGSNIQTGATKAYRAYAENAGTGSVRPIASNSACVAIGMNTSATGVGSIAFGEFATSSGSFTTAIGYNSKASLASDNGLGSYATATGGSSTAVGYNAASSASTATALGTASTASGIGSTAIGASATASNTYAVAIGANATASQAGQWSMAFGPTEGQIEGIVLTCSATVASTSYYLTSSGAAAPSTTNQIPCPASSSVIFSGVILAKQTTAGGTNQMGWYIEGVATRGSTGNISIVNSSIRAIGTMTAPTGWTLTCQADTTNQCVQLVFNMGSTTMSVNAHARMEYMKFSN